MSIFLNEALQKEIYNEIRMNFSDFHLFDSLVADKLRQAIADANSTLINSKTISKLVVRYYDPKAFKTPERKAVFSEIQTIFKATYVLIRSLYPNCRAELFMTDANELINQYKDCPHFSSVDADEASYLLKYRNMLKVALLLIPAKLNKSCLLGIAGRLEGSHNEYITGGGQRPAVSRRVTIYEREGGVESSRRSARTTQAGDDTGDATAVLMVPSRNGPPVFASAVPPIAPTIDSMQAFPSSSSSSSSSSVVSGGNNSLVSTATDKRKAAEAGGGAKGGRRTRVKLKHVHISPQEIADLAKPPPACFRDVSAKQIGSVMPLFAYPVADAAPVSVSAAPAIVGGGGRGPLQPAASTMASRGGAASVSLGRSTSGMSILESFRSDSLSFSLQDPNMLQSIEDLLSFAADAQNSPPMQRISSSAAATAGAPHEGSRISPGVTFPAAGAVVDSGHQQPQPLGSYAHVLAPTLTASYSRSALGYCGAPVAGATAVPMGGSSAGSGSLAFASAPSGLTTVGSSSSGIGGAHVPLSLSHPAAMTTTIGGGGKISSSAAPSPTDAVTKENLTWRETLQHLKKPMDVGRAISLDLINGSFFEDVVHFLDCQP